MAAGVTFVPAADTDPVAVARYQADMAKLKPSALECSHCGRALAKRELEAGRRCFERAECILRACYAGGRFPGAQGIDMSGFRELVKYQRARGIGGAARGAGADVGAAGAGAAVGPRPVARPAVESGIEIAVAILKARRGRPMNVTALARAVIASGRAAGLKGKTPEATVAAQIYTAAKAGRLFVKVNRGTVGLIPAAAANGKVGSS